MAKYGLQQIQQQLWIPLYVLTFLGMNTIDAKKATVLIVDDESEFSNQTQDCLEKNGYTVVTAKNGHDALEIADRGGIDLVLLDIIMPKLNGVEVTKILRRNSSTKDIPIIVISSMTEYKDRVEFFRIGANDYMPKPIDNGELLARVELQLSKVKLSLQVEEANNKLLQKNRLLEQHVSRIEQDLSVARRVQDSLKPPSQSRFSGVRISFKYISTDNLASDCFDYLEDAAGIIHVIIADVSGHGIASALLAAQLKVLFVTLTEKGFPPSKVMVEINKISVQLMTGGYHFTAVYLQYDPSSRHLFLVNGGHVPALYLEHGTGRVNLIESNNPSLGFFEEDKFMETKITVNAGDKLLLLTDGIVENTNSHGDQYSMNRVVETFKLNSEIDPVDLIDKIAQASRDFGSVPIFSDDATVGILEFS